MIPEAEERVNTLLQEAREQEAAGRSIQAGIARRTAELNQVNGSFKDWADVMDGGGISRNR